MTQLFENTMRTPSLIDTNRGVLVFCGESARASSRTPQNAARCHPERGRPILCFGLPTPARRGGRDLSSTARQMASLADEFGVGGGRGDADEALAVEEEIDFQIFGFYAQLLELLAF